MLNIDPGCKVGDIEVLHLWATSHVMHKMFVSFYFKVKAYSHYNGGILRVEGSNLVQVEEV